jgi:tetratricopeptide (TPR) repeat protein
MGKRLALLIGNGSYHHWEHFGKSAANVNALGQALLNPYIGAFDDVQILIDGSVETIKKAVNTFVSGKKPDDTILLYFTGHGMRSNQGQWFFVCEETPKPPEKGLSNEALEITAISANFIRTSLDVSNTRAQCQFIIIDTCFAGAFTMTLGPAKRGQPVWQQFAGKGRFVLAAAGFKQLADVGPSYIPTSTFTYFLVQGLITGAADIHKTGWITSDDLFRHVSQYVPEEVIDQQPEEYTKRRGGPLVVARNPLFVRNPDHAYEQHNKAYILSILNQDRKEMSRAFEKALQSYDASLRVAPHNATAWLHKGNVLFHLHRYQEALSAYEVAVGLIPNDAVVWHNWGCTFYQLHRYTEALSAYEKACSLDQDDPEIWYNLGHVYSDLGRYMDAYQAFSLAKQIDPTAPKIWSNLGFVLSHLGDDEQARYAHARAEESKFPSEEWVTFGKGLILERYFWNKDAYDVLDTASRLDMDWCKKMIRKLYGYEEEEDNEPNDPVPWYQRGFALLQLERHEEAIEAYEEALKRIPADANADTWYEGGASGSSFPARLWYEKGFALFQLGRNKQALVAFQKALQFTNLDLTVRRDGIEFVPSSDANVWIDKTQRRRDGSLQVGDRVTAFSQGSTPRDFVATLRQLIDRVSR